MKTKIDFHESKYGMAPESIHRNSCRIKSEVA